MHAATGINQSPTLPIKFHIKKANPLPKVFQDLSKSCPNTICNSFKFLQLWAAPLFPLCIILWDNTVHQGFFKVWYCGPPIPTQLRQLRLLSLNPVRKLHYITTWKKLRLMGFATPLLYFSYSSLGDNYALSFGTMVSIILGLWGI